MTNYSDLLQRLRGPIKHPQQLINASHDAADAIEVQAQQIKTQEETIMELIAVGAYDAHARISELETALEKERERCAKIAEKIYYPNEGKMIAKEIRESVK